MDKNKKRDITVRIVSVFIAIILWTYVASVENPTITQDIANVPVKLLNADALSEMGFVLINSQDKIEISVTGRKQDVMAVKPGDFAAQANFAGSYLVKGMNSIPVEITDVPKNIERPNQPLYISVELDELVENSVPVKVQVSGQPREGYSSLLPTVKPNAVVIKGASRYVSSVNSVVVKPDITDATSDVGVSLPVQLLDKSGKAIFNQSDPAAKIECTPNTVEVSIPIQRSKEVPINIVTTGKLPAGVYSRSMTVSPSKVTIVGSEAVVDGINVLDTDPISLDTITGNVTRQVNLKIPDGVTVSDNVQTVSVSIGVETTINRVYNVPVSYINRPDGLNADLITNTIAVTVSGQESLLDSLSSADFSAVIDLANAPVEDGEYEFDVKLTYPQSVTLVSGDQQKVKVKITNKQG